MAGRVQIYANSPFTQWNSGGFHLGPNSNAEVFAARFTPKSCGFLLFLSVISSEPYRGRTGRLLHRYSSNHFFAVSSSGKISNRSSMSDISFLQDLPGALIFFELHISNQHSTV